MGRVRASPAGRACRRSTPHEERRRRHAERHCPSVRTSSPSPSPVACVSPASAAPARRARARRRANRPARASDALVSGGSRSTPATRRDDADRHVDEEHRLPAERVTRKPPRTGPMAAPPLIRIDCNAHRHAALPLREDVGEDRQRVRRDQRAADRLQHTRARSARRSPAMPPPARSPARTPEIPPM